MRSFTSFRPLLRSAWLWSVLAAVTMVLPVHSAWAATCGAGYGEVNGVGGINVADAVCVIQRTLWEASPAGPAPGCISGAASVADLDCSGAVDVVDVMLAIAVALDVPLSVSVDTNTDGCADACGAVCVPANCDDSNSCTNDTCTPGGCTHAPLGTCTGQPVFDVFRFADIASDLVIPAASTSTSITETGVLEITSNALNQTGAAWYAHPLPLTAGFEAAFRMHFASPVTTGADGMAFVLHSVGVTPGPTGNGKGIQPASSSVAVAFDSYDNGASDPSDGFIEIRQAGAVVATHDLGYDLSGSGAHDVVIRWQAGAMTVDFDGATVLSASVDLVAAGAVLPDGTAWAGFTARTGGAAEAHRVSHWSHTELCTPLSCDDPDSCTVGDVCVAGTCLPGGPMDCDDGDPCTGPDACIAGVCTSAPTTCSASESCVEGHCGPTAFVLGTNALNYGDVGVCPAGYVVAGTWRTGGETLGDALAEGVDVHDYPIDSGVVWLCTTDPALARMVVVSGDCGESASSCASGTLRGSFQVGAACDSTTHARDADGVALDAGTLGLCVALGVDLALEIAQDDCGAATPVPCPAAGRSLGQWRVSPTSCGVGIGATGVSTGAIDAGWAQLCSSTAAWPSVTKTTIQGALLAGYQGWFAAPTDGAGVGWRHWGKGQQPPSAASATFDLYPDMSELGPSERFDTAMTLPDGSAAQVFSSAVYPTVDRHVRWMAEYGLDGAFAQRFITAAVNPNLSSYRDLVQLHVATAAEAHGRAFAVMYDISGADSATVVGHLVDDWIHLVDDLGMVDSSAYLREGGVPVLGMWGFGFPDRPGTPAQAVALLDWLREEAPERYRAWMVGGVPHKWRTGTGDSQPGYSDVYLSYDAVSPWSVGRYSNQSGFDNALANTVSPDLGYAAAQGLAYAPVAWPGFSWANLLNDPALLNSIPRDGGRFLWHQLKGLVAAGSDFIYIAMFDEVDEGTAIFKAAATAAAVPTSGQFLTLDADGESLPEDFYLRVTGAGAKALHGQIPTNGTLPFP